MSETSAEGLKKDHASSNLLSNGDSQGERLDMAPTGGKPKRIRQSESEGERKCVALVDLDCFFVAVERQHDPGLIGVPVGVAQYTKSETLIAISYEAKHAGVKRGMFGYQARKICPELRIVKVETKYDKADLTKYREASEKVLAIASRFCHNIERASVDEFYLDLTDAIQTRMEQMTEQGVSPTWASTTLFCTEFDTVEERDNYTLRPDETEDTLLAIGTGIIYDIRRAIKEELNLDCSAGIASNRFLAKCIAGIRKPATQIALKRSFEPVLCRTMPIQKARSLGGKLGELLKNQFGLTFLGDLLEMGEAKLCQTFGEKEGKRLFALGSGKDDTPVVPRVRAKSIGCSKQFPGPQVLMTRSAVSEWLAKLCAEAVERLEKDGRRPTTVTVGTYNLGSRSTSNFNAAKITKESLISNAESLFNRLIEPDEIPRKGGIHSLSLNLTGFPVDPTTESELSNKPTTKEKWICSRCTFENDAIWLRCEACDTRKSEFEESKPQSSETIVSKAPGVNQVVPIRDIFGRSGQEKKPASVEECITVEILDDDTAQTGPREALKTRVLPPVQHWICKSCTYAENDPRFLRCEMCDTLK